MLNEDDDDDDGKYMVYNWLPLMMVSLIALRMKIQHLAYSWSTWRLDVAWIQHWKSVMMSYCPYCFRFLRPGLTAFSALNCSTCSTFVVWKNFFMWDGLSTFQIQKSLYQVHSQLWSCCVCVLWSSPQEDLLWRVDHRKAIGWQPEKELKNIKTIKLLHFFIFFQQFEAQNVLILFLHAIYTKLHNLNKFSDRVQNLKEIQQYTVCILYFNFLFSLWVFLICSYFSGGFKPHCSY